jgi:cell division protein FtsQ
MNNWKKILSGIMWSMISIALIALSIVAWRAKSAKKCTAIKIELTGNAGGYLFMDQKEILKLISNQGVNVGTPVGSINLNAIQQALMATKWVEKTNIYIDNQQQLNIQIEQRVPIARIFTTAGNSFYIDKVAQKLPLKNLSVMRLPVFTGFPSDNENLSKPDSILLQSIQHFSRIIQKDSFFLAQIAQINIAPNRDFELIPTIGDHMVLIGKAENIEDKLNRLYTFYKKVLVSSGLNAYAVLDLRFDHQVVALKKGMQPIQYSEGAAQQINLDAPIKVIAVIDTIKNALDVPKTDSISVKVNVTSKKANLIVKKEKGKENEKEKGKEKEKKKEEKEPAAAKTGKLAKSKTNSPVVKKQNDPKNNKSNIKTLNNTEPTPKAILPKKEASNNKKNN